MSVSSRSLINVSVRSTKFDPAVGCLLSTLFVFSFLSTNRLLRVLRLLAFFVV